MAYQSTFQRYELKYLLTRQEKQRLLQIMEPHMELDQYGRTTIRNLYFDTDRFRLIRRSLEKPAYKEKLRVRSYQPVGPEDPVFVELKKKYRDVVYKRRLVVREREAADSFSRDLALPVHSQIGEEIEYFRRYYGSLCPVVFLSYEREAYYALDGSDFRVTFDENILYRDRDLTLAGAVYGTGLLEGGQTLMEIKTSGGIPLWMSHELTRQRIFKTSFSKYGSAYLHMLARDQQKGVCYA